MQYPNQCTIDFGLSLPAKKPRRKAPDNFLLQHFDPLTATKINFVPIMLRSLVRRTATDLADHLAAKRIDPLKRHTRALREILRECEADDLRDMGPNEVHDRKIYTDRYAAKVHTDCWLFLRNLEEQAINTIPGKDRQVCALITFAALVSEYARQYELQMDKLISDTCGQHVTKAPDKCSTVVQALCVDIAESFGYELEISQDARLWLQILSNKALDLCETCYYEEEQQTKHPRP